MIWKGEVIMKIKILGTKYKIKYRVPSEDTRLEESDGYCDKTTKSIVVHWPFAEAPQNVGDLKTHRKKVLRHEIIHAFLFESGLAECSEITESWALNEEMVDWIAYQSPKIFKAFKKANCL